MKTKHILSLLATMPIVAASIPLTLTSCNKQNKDYVDVICENESIVMSVVTVAKNEDADIYIKSKHNDVFINELESVKVGEVPLTEGQYTFGTCEDTSGWTHLLHIEAEYVTNYVSFNLELNEEKVIGKPTVSVKIISGGNLPATKLEGRLPDKIYHDTGFETNLIVHNEENEEGDPLYWWTSKDATVTYGGNKLSDEFWDFDINPENPLKAHFKLYPLEDIDSNQISISLNVYDTKETFSGYVSDGVTTIDLGEFATGDADISIPLNRFLPLGSTKVVKDVTLFRYVEGWQDVEPGPYTYNFDHATNVVTLKNDILQGNQLYLDVVLEVNHSTTFENDTWSEIGYWSRAPITRAYTVYKLNPAFSKFIGLEREVTFDGVKQKVRVIGENRDPITDNPDKKATWTFEFVNCLEDSNGLVTKNIGSKEDAFAKFWQYISGANRETNRIRDYLSSDEFVSKMEPSVNKIVKSVTKIDRVGHYQWDPYDRPYHKFKRGNVDDRYFILTCTDMGGHRRNQDSDDKVLSSRYGAEGVDLGDNCAAYEYYVSLSGIPSDGKIEARIKYDRAGNKQNCWTSTPSIAESEDRYEDRAMYIDTNGALSNARQNNSYCICPVFCI